VWLVIFGLATILDELLCALMVPLMRFTNTMAANIPHPPSPIFYLIPISGIYLFFAIALIWLGVGSMTARRWARALLAIWSWSWFVIGLLSVISVTIFPVLLLRGDEK
jgi:hypothetical protein